jgi:hypothetical protein
VAVTTTRLVALVAGVAVAGALAGYTAGRLTQPEPGVSTGAPLPMAAAPAVPSASPTTPPLPKKTPVPDQTRKLDPDELGFRTAEFSVTKKPHPPVRVSVQVPEDWQIRRNPVHPDEVRYVDSTGKRWIRIESGFLIERPPIDSMNILVANLRGSQPFENDLRLGPQTSGPLTGRNGDSRNIATLAYTYIPGQSVRSVLVRWIGFGAPGNVAVEMSVTGLPQDEPALEKVLERASTTVLRFD